MWQCVECSEKIEDEFEVCWSCGTTKEGIRNPSFRDESEIQGNQQRKESIDGVEIFSSDKNRIKSVVSEARWFWLAIPLSLLCPPFVIVLPIWYVARLFQWKMFANKYPALLEAGAKERSIQDDFQSSQWKLVTGIAAGIFFLAAYLTYFFIGMRE